MRWGGWRMLRAWLQGRRPGPVPLWEAEVTLEAEVLEELQSRPR